MNQTLTGEVTVSETKVHFSTGGHRHIICPFYAVNKDPKRSLGSLTFSVGGHKWQIVCYPGGETPEVAEYVSLFLGYRGPEKECHANWRLTLVNQNDSEKSRTRAWIKGDKFNKFMTGRRWGWQKFIKREDLINLDNGFLKEDTVVFEASLDVYVKQETKSLKDERFEPFLFPVPPPTLGSDFEMLFTKANIAIDNNSNLAATRNEDGLEALADVKFILDGGFQTVFAHSQILAARSPVFMTLFSQSFTESHLNDDRKQNRMISIPIPDIHPTIFTEMLRYVYAGEVNWSYVDAKIDELMTAAFRKTLSEQTFESKTNYGDHHDIDQSSSKKRSPPSPVTSPHIILVQNNTYMGSSVSLGSYGPDMDSHSLQIESSSHISEVSVASSTKKPRRGSIAGDYHAHPTGRGILGDTNQFPSPIGNSEDYSVQNTRFSQVKQQLKWDPEICPGPDSPLSSEKLLEEKYGLSLQFTIGLFEVADKYELNRLRLLAEHKISEIFCLQINQINNKVKRHAKFIPLPRVKHLDSVRARFNPYASLSMPVNATNIAISAENIWCTGYLDVLIVAERHQSKKLKKLCLDALTSPGILKRTKRILFSKERFSSLGSGLLSELFCLSRLWDVSVAGDDDLDTVMDSNVGQGFPEGGDEHDEGDSFSGGEDYEAEDQMMDVQLRQELSARGFNGYGDRRTLQARLFQARQFRPTQEFEDE